MCKKIIETYLQQYPITFDFYHKMLDVGDVYIMGGTARELKNKKSIKTLKDIDFCIYIKDQIEFERIINDYIYRCNAYDGYKILNSEILLDIWDIKNTWGFKNGLVKVNNDDYFEKLVDTVFLNIDALVYDVSNDRWNDHIYNSAIKNKKLDIVLKDNPFVELNILRAIILKKQYGMQYSDELKNLILHYSDQPNFLNLLMQIQTKRYDKNKISFHELQKEIKIIQTL